MKKLVKVSPIVSRVLKTEHHHRAKSSHATYTGSLISKPCCRKSTILEGTTHIIILLNSYLKRAWLPPICLCQSQDTRIYVRIKACNLNVCHKFLKMAPGSYISMLLWEHLLFSFLGPFVHDDVHYNISWFYWSKKLKYLL